MLRVLLATYLAVFTAELAGDKLLYTTGVLAARYRAVPIVYGLGIAFAAKMAVAVLAGTAISRLPQPIVAAMTAVNFLAIAYVLWRGSAGGLDVTEYPTSRAVMVSFAAVFFSEWGDLGQITAATMAAKFALPAVVWLGAVGAMVSKGVLAASAGSRIRQWVVNRLSPQMIRCTVVGVVLILGILSTLDTIGGRTGP
jgi:putative Ca2+/H+ antiporter (TMEM165/GDT1 family)